MKQNILAFRGKYILKEKRGLKYIKTPHQQHAVGYRCTRKQLIHHGWWDFLPESVKEPIGIG